MDELRALYLGLTDAEKLEVRRALEDVVEEFGSESLPKGKRK
jgi:hypothetical protein